MKKKSSIHAWAFYDWANSVYPLIITTVLFPLFYTNITTQSTTEGKTTDIITFFSYSASADIVYSYITAFTYLIIALISPVFSAIADLKFYKKSFLTIFCLLGSISCISLYYFNLENIELSFLSIMFAAIGFWVSLIFYNAYLPEISTVKKFDQVSAYGYTLGYIGSSLLLITIIALLQFSIITIQQSFIIVGFWWFLFSLYPLKNLPGKLSFKGMPSIISDIKPGLNLFVTVFKNNLCQRSISYFWAIYFFLSLGMQTIIILALFFAQKEIQWDKDQDVNQILMICILLIQFIAALGAYFFSYLSKRVGNKLALNLASILWIVLCIIAYFSSQPIHFYILTVLQGVILGGTQSLARSTYTKFIQGEKEKNTLFSIYGVIEKVGIVFGTFLFGFVNDMTGSMRNSVLVLVFSFVIASILIKLMPNQKEIL